MDPGFRVVFRSGSRRASGEISDSQTVPPFITTTVDIIRGVPFKGSCQETPHTFN